MPEPAGASVKTSHKVTKSRSHKMGTWKGKKGVDYLLGRYEGTLYVHVTGLASSGSTQRVTARVFKASIARSSCRKAKLLDDDSLDLKSPSLSPHTPVLVLYP